MKSDGLENAIELVEAGNFLLLLDGKGGKENLAGWLRELRDLRRDNAERNRASMMGTLTGFAGLTEEEAKRVLQHVEAGGSIEYEEGPCRKCNGTGLVEEVVRTTCFGQETRNENCFTCDRSGVDKKRVKVPEANPA